MTAITIFGRVADAHGLSLQYYLDDNLREHTRAWAAPPSEFRAAQPRGLVRLGHRGWPVGRIAAIERDHNGIWITATSDNLNVVELIENRDGWYLSSETDSTDDGTAVHKDILLKGAALVRSSASVGIGEAFIVDGDVTRPYDRERWHRLPEWARKHLDRAGEYALAHRDEDVLTKAPATTQLLVFSGDAYVNEMG